MKVLFVDACPRDRSVSRSYRLGRAFMDEYLCLNSEAEVVEYRLDDMNLLPLTGRSEKERSALSVEEKLSSPAYETAREFAAADMIVICAPYWDFAFPACLKAFIENICVYGITFEYVSDLPKGLCRAEHLVYLTSAGSPIGNDNWGGDYLKAVTGKLLGVRNFHQISADGLDMQNADVEGILKKAITEARALAQRL